MRYAALLAAIRPRDPTGRIGSPARPDMARPIRPRRSTSADSCSCRIFCSSAGWRMTVGGGGGVRPLAPTLRGVRDRLCPRCAPSVGRRVHARLRVGPRGARTVRAPRAGAYTRGAARRGRQGRPLSPDAHTTRAPRGAFMHW